LNKKENDYNNKQQGSLLHAFAAFSHIGFTIAACIFIGVFLGKFLDSLLGTSPRFLLFFSLLGMAAACMAIYYLAKRNMQNPPENKDKKSDLEKVNEQGGNL